MVNLKYHGTINLNSNFTQIINRPKIIHGKNRKASLIANSNIYKNQNLKIYHQNICGLQYKSDELVVSLYPELPDILYIPEHHLNAMQMQIVSLNEYNLGTEFCRQSFHKGGVCTVCSQI
jgi:hypothetical protein